MLEVDISDYEKGSENIKEEREQDGQKRRDLGRGGTRKGEETGE